MIAGNCSGGFSICGTEHTDFGGEHTDFGQLLILCKKKNKKTVGSGVVEVKTDSVVKFVLTSLVIFLQFTTASFREQNVSLSGV